MNKRFLYGNIIILVSLFWGTSVHALEFDKPITSSVIIHKNSHSAIGFSQSLPSKKYVTLMNIKLTPTQKQSFLQFHTATAPSSNTELNINLPRRVDIGMNGVPVLDQGPHGSCVTFANTAAIDALLGKGDYISQLCHLQLGSYFEQKGYLPSGWDGSSGPLVLNQIWGFGIVNKNNQRTKTCGGLKEYPLTSPMSTGSPMLLDEFKLSSENLNENLFWHSLLNVANRLAWNPTVINGETENLLLTIKNILAIRRPYQDSRLSFGVLLPVDYCSAGACARYRSDEDTWALTKEIINDTNPNFGGHEMIITGYDDDAVAIDHNGNKHQGLLVLRNSWGDNAGDHGNYYMTYDFFKQFVLEVQKITLLKD